MTQGNEPSTSSRSLARFVLLLMLSVVLATGLGMANMSVLFKATDSVDFYYNSSLMGSFNR